MRPTPESAVYMLSGPSDNYNWTLFQLAKPGVVEKILIDTQHNKNNPPVCFAIEGCFAPNMNKDNYYFKNMKWVRAVNPTRVLPHSEKVVDVEVCCCVLSSVPTLVLFTDCCSLLSVWC